MPTKRKWATVLLVMGLVAAAAASQTNEDKNKDAMFPDGHEYNFGKVKKGKIVKHAFRVVNRSEGPLRLVSVHNGSGCNSLTASITQETLQRDEEGKVIVAVDTGSFAGSKIMGVWLTTEREEVTRKFMFSLTCISEE